MGDMTRNLNDTLSDRKIIERYGYIYPKHPLSERVLELRYVVSDMKYLESLPDSPRRNELLSDLKRLTGERIIDIEIEKFEAQSLSHINEIAMLKDQIAKYSEAPVHVIESRTKVSTEKLRQLLSSYHQSNLIAKPNIISDLIDELHLFLGKVDVSV